MNDEWQSIDSAPNEGRVVVFGGRHYQAEIVPADGDWWRRLVKEGSKSAPTHWRPLPPPPGAPT